MTLSFPNPSRNFDEVRKAVRFTGYDNLFEVQFFVDAVALSKSETGEYSQADCLTAFDLSRDLIHKAACKIYSRNRRTPYMLTAADF